MLDVAFHEGLRSWAAAVAGQGNVRNGLGVQVQNRPKIGSTCLLATAAVRGTAKITCSQLMPVSRGSLTGARLTEEVLLVVMADDAGWGLIRGRVSAVPGLRSCPKCQTAAATQPSAVSSRLSASDATCSMVQKHFDGAGLPLRRVGRLGWEVGSSHAHVQHDFRGELTALQQVYPQRSFAADTAKHRPTDGSGQTSGERCQDRRRRLRC